MARERWGNGRILEPATYGYQNFFGVFGLIKHTVPTKLKEVRTLDMDGVLVVVVGVKLESL
jgi:hypothetical protein